MGKGKHSKPNHTPRWPLALLAVLLAAAAIWGAAKWTNSRAVQPEAPSSGQAEIPINSPAEPEPELPPEPEPEPELPPEPEPDPLREVLDGMELREKICQMFIVFPSALTGTANVTTAGEKTQLGLEKYPVGGLLYDRSNMVDQEQVRAMLETAQSFSKIPLILTCDEEGGRVNRLMATVGKIGRASCRERV